MFWENFPRAGLEGFGKLFYVSTLICEIPAAWGVCGRLKCISRLWDCQNLPHLTFRLENYRIETEIKIIFFYIKIILFFFIIFKIKFPPKFWEETQIDFRIYRAEFRDNQEFLQQTHRIYPPAYNLLRSVS